MAEVSEQELRDMKPHEVLILKEHHILIIRVVGGWIYWKAASAKIEREEGKESIPCSVAGVFVPENVPSPASIS